jgi:hypothetical protein
MLTTQKGHSDEKIKIDLSRPVHSKWSENYTDYFIYLFFTVFDAVELSE